MHRILILPDIRPARYPADLKAGYRISGTGRIPDIWPDFSLNIQISIKICKYRKCTNSIRFIEDFLFPNIKHSNFYTKAVTVSRRHFWKFWQVKSGIRPGTGYKQKAGFSGRISGASLVIMESFKERSGSATLVLTFFFFFSA
jgi:hypothetical protein